MDQMCNSSEENNVTGIDSLNTDMISHISTTRYNFDSQNIPSDDQGNSFDDEWSSSNYDDTEYFDRMLRLEIKEMIRRIRFRKEMGQYRMIELIRRIEVAQIRRQIEIRKMMMTVLQLDSDSFKEKLRKMMNHQNESEADSSTKTTSSTEKKKGILVKNTQKVNKSLCNSASSSKKKNVKGVLKSKVTPLRRSQRKPVSKAKPCIKGTICKEKQHEISEE